MPDLRQVLPQLAGGPRYIFVGGLHRSGTSLVARLISAMEGVGAITAAPVPEQEGVYLQGAIPHTARHGIPGAFAFDPVQHLTEASEYNTLEVQRRLTADWDRWYPAHAPLRVEKSPVNLLRARLYQQLFPTASFVFVVRHPSIVALATRKWSDAGLDRLVAHWDQAHRLLAGDLPYLHNYVIVRYEDLVTDPQRQLSRLAALTGCPVPPFVAIDDRNADYADQIAIVPSSEMATTFGYMPGTITPGEPRIEMGAHYFRRVAEQLRAGAAGR